MLAVILVQSLQDISKAVQADYKVSHISCAYSETREECRLRGGRREAGQEVERKTRVNLGALARRVARAAICDRHSHTRSSSHRSDVGSSLAN